MRDFLISVLAALVMAAIASIVTGIVDFGISENVRLMIIGGAAAVGMFFWTGSSGPRRERVEGRYGHDRHTGYFFRLYKNEEEED